VWTHPDRSVPHSHLVPDQQSRSLGDIWRRDGGRMDISRLPLSAHDEEHMLFTGTLGEVTLCVPEWRYEVTVHWEADKLPACLIWLTNDARDHYPFCGNFRALGIEPIAAPFDLGVRVATWTGNPLARQGIATCIDLRRDRPWRTEYSVSFRATR
jgi:hypothetical protein